MRSPIMLPYSMYPALSRSTLVPRDLLTNEVLPPKMGSQMLHCKYDRITSLECRTEATLAVVETVSKLCDDIRSSPYFWASNAPAPAWRRQRVSQSL